MSTTASQTDEPDKATRFVYEERTGDDRRIVEYLSNARRVVTLGPGDDPVALYDVAADAIWLPHLGGTETQPVDRDAAKRLARLVSDQVARFEESWKALPPEQAKRSREGLRRLLRGPSPPTPERAVATGDRGFFAGYECVWHRLEAEDGRELGRACIADVGTLGLDRALLGMLRLVADVFTTLGEAGGESLDATAFGQPMLSAGMLTGLPLSVTIAGENGTDRRGLELLRVTHEAVAPEIFSTP